jgi:protein FAM32A
MLAADSVRAGRINLLSAGLLHRARMSAPASSKPAAAYKNVVKGKLSLKGSKPKVAGGAAGGTTLKRKKEETDAERIEREDAELARLLAQKKENEAKAAEREAAEAAAMKDVDPEERAKQQQIDDLDEDLSLTKAQRDFQKAQRQRELEQIQKKIAKTHRQRVEEYNAFLGTLTEHNDIPRVGPG